MRDSCACQIVVAIGLASIAVIACSSGSRPTTPVAPSIPATPPSPTVAPSQTFTLSGRVTDAASDAPVEGVTVYVTPARFPPGGFWPQPTLKRVASDRDGNYRVSGLPDWGVPAWVSTASTGYVQPCAAPMITLNGDSTVDVEVLSETNVSASGLLRHRPGTRTITGTIFTSTDAGRHPVAGALVDWEPSLDTPVAYTKSDPSGRYVLCGLPTDERLYLLAAAVIGRVTEITVDPGGNTVVDIVVK